MAYLLNVIKYDYVQRTRSYAFLITLCASLAIAYTFVPEPNANYSTLRIGSYIGYYNSHWFGYVTATMTSIFLSLFGFYLVNGTIKNDMKIKVGQIMASTSISNFKYLLSKTISNFLILTSIVVIVFLMSILLFFLYDEGYSFELIAFVKPYLVITIPTMFYISVIAILFEVILPKHQILQNVLFFFLFSSLMVSAPKSDNAFALDIFGTKIVTHEMENTVKSLLDIDEKTELSIGYILGNIKKSDKFLFKGINFSSIFLVSRIAWSALGFILVLCFSFVFHRFSLKERHLTKLKKHIEIDKNKFNNFNLTRLPKASNNYSLLPIVKTELLLLLRHGKRWVWLLNLAGMLALILTPIKVAHQIILPILWFLQVGRISTVSIKETLHYTELYMFATYKPLNRLFVSQLISAVLLMIFLALPLVLRLSFTGNVQAALSIILGSVFIVFLASVLGMLTKGSKLFEVAFFMLTYANINLIPFLDYFGAMNTSSLTMITVFLINLLLIISSFALKKLLVNN